MMTRRVFASALAAPLLASAQSQQKWFQISLAEWSVHKAIFGNTLKTLEFPQLARDKFGIEGLEFVNTLWGVPTQGYIQRLKHNMNATGTKGVMIMCDDEGMMGHSEKTARMKAARNHYKWVDYAAELGCKGI